jgi:hypothetical protein
MTSAGSGRFAIVVHDVAPGFERHVERIASALGAALTARASVAVVPCWHGRAWSRADAPLVRRVNEGFGDLLQHGCTHSQARPGLVSWLTCGANEHHGLSRDEIRRRVGRGRAILRRVFGRDVSGFVAPAWVAGRATLDDLACAGMAGVAGFWSIQGANFEPIPLATWSWDWGRFRSLGRAGQCAADLIHRLWPAALPCVVIHPADVDRGFLWNVRRVIDRLEGEGRRPVLISELVGGAVSLPDDHRLWT